jgi:hypothetical protein
MICSRCGQHVKLPGYEEHRKICVPIVERHDYFVDKYGLSRRKNSMTDEVEVACEHPIYQGSIRNVWENETIWHRASEALGCAFFKRKAELRESMKVQVIVQWARQNRR